MMKRFIENLIPPTFRPRSPKPTSVDHQLDRQADRSSTPTPTLHAPTSDDFVGQSKSATPTILVGTRAGVPDIKDDKNLVPTIAVEVESPTSATPSKKFVEVRSTNAQYDLVVLHVAYVLQKSSNLQCLILEIVNLHEEGYFEDIVQNCVGLITRLIAALDSPTVAQAGVEQAIMMLLETIKTVDLNDPKKASDEIRRSIEKIEIDHPYISTIEQQKDSSCFSKVRSKVLGVALPMLEIIKTGSSMIPVPMVHPLIGVVAGFLQAADQACNNFEWMRWLSITAAECVIGIAMRCPEKMEQQWTEAIKTLQKKLSDIVQQAEIFCKRSVLFRFLQQGCDKGAIEMMKENLKAAIGCFNAQVGMNIKLDLDKMSRQIEDLSLETLPRLPSDRFYQDDRFQASREKEIGETLRWIEDSESMSFFWIHGAAGIGKSTLARRLFDLVKREGILGTFAYFSIGNDIDPKELVQMMARELSSLHPGCRPAVARAINECSGTHQSLDEYLTHFLVNPVVSLAYAGSLVIIVDALDEWVHSKQFLKALCQVNPPTLSLKFVMTSRHSMDIESVITGAATLYQLTTVSATICRKYFEEQFDDFTWDGPRPDEKRLHKLVELADGLLIWAATVCTVVRTLHPNKGPLDILDEILLSSSIVSHEERMDDLYRKALERIFPSKDDGSRLKLFRSMVALREDLPLTEFARLVNMRVEFVRQFCSYLTAFHTRGTLKDKIVQPAAKLFHTSFIEHLGQLNEAHGVMADNCIYFFKRVTGPDVAKDFPFQEAEQYIGEHWIYHLLEAPFEKRSNLFPDIPSNCLCLWVGCLLSHLYLVGDKYGYGPGSDALKTLSGALASPKGIMYTSIMLLSDISATEMVVVAFQKALNPGRIDYQNANLNTKNPKDSEHWAHVINGLAISMQRIRRLNSEPIIRNLDEAIDLLKNFFNVYTPDADLPSWFNNLGNLYSHRYERTSNLQDIDCAVFHHQSAVESTPSGHAVLPSWFNNLGNLYLSHFEHTGNLQDIDHAISSHQSAVESTPFGHAGLPS
ncbi:hypothetical protein BYT27DRAFT_7134863 [Phlegmacium glaucopus]|nr:hypothetical protein BYT27DRAFT_7134863 [Phlegmacium glaucopus]